MGVLEIGLIVAGSHFLIAAAKYVAKRTKTAKDDKVVAFIAKYEEQILAYVVKKATAGSPAVPRPMIVDHRER